MTNALVPFNSENRFYPTLGNDGLAFFDSVRCRFVFGDAGSYSYAHPQSNEYYDPMLNIEPFMVGKRGWECLLDDIMRDIAAMHNVPYDFMVRPPSKGNRKETI